MKKLFVIGLILLSFGCIRVHSYAKPDVNFSKINKVAVITSDNIITDTITIEFIKKGYQIFPKHQLEKLIDEIPSDPEEKVKAAKALILTLINNNVDAIVIGEVVRKKELRQKPGVFLGRFYFPPSLELGEDMSLFVKMYDVKSEDLLWGANVIEFDFNEINKVAEKIAETIP